MNNIGNYKIGKEFEFCYGHRVWSQQLKEGYSEDMCLACRHLHGHQGKIIVYLESIDNTELTNGMVTDFKHLGWFKKWVDNVLDHKFIMDISDPLIHHELGSKSIDIISSLWYNDEGWWKVTNPHKWDILPAIGEKLEGMVFVDFVPTSENLSKWLCNIVNTKMNKIGVKCSHIQFFETPKSQSNFYN